MDLFDQDQDREQKDGAEHAGPRQSSSRSLPSRSRKAGKMPKKRRAARGDGKRGRTRAVPSPAQPAFTRRPEPPPIIPQPSLDSPEEEPSEPEEPRQEPAPPSASAAPWNPKGDDDDLFEYVF